MDSKKRSLLDDTGTSAASALRRRLTRTQAGHRLSMRRVAASISDSSSSSSVSVASLESDLQSTTCVLRETSGDECALHRFIVWTAVKRNACPTMTDGERRECPLLRCRKRFPSHELMLCHLYSCPHLASGEYWCYDCGKSEKIMDDSKCRRCLGHPSRRKKIMSMAKNLFSSLGHKAKSDSFSDISVSPIEEPSIPAYDADTDIEHMGFELYSTEIHEIDSSEIPLETILDTSDESEPVMNRQPPVDRKPLPILPPSPATVHLQPQPSGCDDILIDDQQPNGFAPPSTVAPINLFNDASAKATERPSLQLYTNGLEDHRANAKRRSRMLAPSSSVRSTTSTASTNSTSSTASYCISAVSGWSGAWAGASDFDSALTSPIDDPISSGDALPSDILADLCKPSKNSKAGFDKDALDSLLSELPADMPMLDVLPASDPLQGTLGVGDAAFSYNSSLSRDPPVASDAILPNQSNKIPMAPRLAFESARDGRVSATSLIGNAQVALQMHIAESMTKLDNNSGNHLVKELQGLPPITVVISGLQTLKEILEGRQDASPIELLCFIHVVYSLSLVLHEQDAPSHWSKLFKQAISYSSWLPYQDRQAYISVVYSVWKPNDLSNGEMMQFIDSGCYESATGSTAWKGKESEQENYKPEPLVFMAQYFLDELELSALRDVNRPEIQASDICIQHLKDANLGFHNNTTFAYAVKYIITIISREYANTPGFIAAMETLLNRVNSSSVSTARRLELELLEAGKMRLPPKMYFEDYIVRIRMHVDSLYAQNLSHFNPRLTYYQHDVELMRSVITELGRGTLEAAPTTQSALPDMDDFMGPMTEDMGGFNFDTFNHISSIPDVMVDPSRLDDSPWLPPPTEDSTSSRAPSTPAAPAPTSIGTIPASSSSSSLTKIESDSCCDICGYRPKGDPQWFRGSMAKHKKLQHASSPPKIYKCPYPNCTSQYKNRPDNLRQHQIEKGHFVEGDEMDKKRPVKRKKTDK